MKGENNVKNKFNFLVTVVLLAMLLSSCGLVGSKSDVIKCTGTVTVTSNTGGEADILDGNQHTVNEIIRHNIKSNCPELTGVFTITANYYDDSTAGMPIWGTFNLKTAYDGGGVFEGTFHGTRNVDGYFSAESNSHIATGSLRGLELTFSSKFPITITSAELPFEGTIRNLPEE